MKTRILLSVLAVSVNMDSFGQNLSVDLTFTAINSASANQYVQLDSIKIMNRTQGDETMLYYPDTTLSIEINADDTLLYVGYSTGFPVGVREIDQETSRFQLFQNYPNPAKEYTVVPLYVPAKGDVSLEVTDILGRKVITTIQLLDKGYHTFRLQTETTKLCVLTASWNGTSKSIKIVNESSYTRKNWDLTYVGRTEKIPLLKESVSSPTTVLESGILDSPSSNETYIFEFATNIPCPGTHTVTYEGQVYNTIQIFSQCWLKENLNVGTMIPGGQPMEDNGVIEKYCYSNKPDSCTKYGGLYQWDEMMQYTMQQGVQGICPPGWHIPTDEEWKVLEGAVDSQYGIGDPLWDYDFWRGFDAGTNLKSTSGWYENGNGTDLYGFSGLPGGRHDESGTFVLIYEYGYWWTSSYKTYNLWSWSRFLDYLSPEVVRYRFVKMIGFSVRCIKDD